MSSPVPPTTNLLARLRAKRCRVGHVFNEDGAGFPEMGPDPDCQEAAGEIERLRVALKNIADANPPPFGGPGAHTPGRY